MSQFGRNTFKQSLLDYIINSRNDYNLDMCKAVSESMEVMAHLTAEVLA